MPSDAQRSGFGCTQKGRRQRQDYEPGRAVGQPRSRARHPILQIPELVLLLLSYAHCT